MLAELIKKSILLIVGLVLLVSIIRILLRARHVNHTERVQIFKKADYFNAWIVLLCFVVTLIYGAFHHIPILPSNSRFINLFISTAYSIGNSLDIGSANPLTSIPTASSSDKPLLIR